MGDEPDADQRLDAQVPTVDALARGRRAGATRGGPVEIGGLPAFVALSAARLKEWMASDLSGLDLLVIQIDGIHMDEDMTLVAAVAVDVGGSTS